MATRRDVLKAAAAASGLLVFNRFGFAADDKKLLPMTPNITMGPFYPEIKPLDKDADLTQIAGRSGRAHGQILHVSGRVLNRNGDPVRNAKLELWQANAAGRYTHPSDPNKAPLDPNFEGYGEQLTDSEGRFHFKTIKPGAYPGLDGMGMRTPHIHFEIFGKQDRMVTQLFFPGEPLNEQDVIFRSVPRNQKGVVAQLDKNPQGLPAGEWLATWDVVLLQG